MLTWKIQLLLVIIEHNVTDDFLLCLKKNKVNKSHEMAVLTHSSTTCVVTFTLVLQYPSFHACCIINYLQLQIEKKINFH